MAKQRESHPASGHPTPAIAGDVKRLSWTRPRALPAATASLLAAALLASSPAWASSSVRGKTVEFNSPNGARERCVALERMPGARYTDQDAEKEAEFCSIDFYRGKYGLCPKVFSTSPGTLVFPLADGAYTGNAERLEREACGGGVNQRGAGGEPISYKMSVNTRATSATFANSSLIYYHFARYFHATAHVPVAVFRSVDRKEHSRRVSARGAALSAGSIALKMNHAGWLALQSAESDPSTYQPEAELFTPDGLLYGVMLHPLGKRYGEEVNGTRQSGWGDGQNRDFQETAPFLALRSALPLASAVEEGRRGASRNPKMAKALGAGATPQQMVFWMSDLIDITLLDFVLGQQDRIGNIDYRTFWYWVQDGRIHSRPSADRTPPADIAGFGPALLRRTELGDNDAGVRVTYQNFAKRTGMLEKLRHYRADAYRQLMRLHHDFASRGPLHEYVRTTFGLSDREFARVVENTAAAAAILRESCKAGRLRFDVEPEEFLLKGTVAPKDVDCGAS
jgi:hypothetical protein